MIRQFSLMNSLNDTISLNDNDLFAYEPQGLGLVITNAYIGVNNNFIPTSSAVTQGQFSVRVLFGAGKGESYKRFADFTKFLGSPPYTLIYETDAGRYQRDCVLAELSKSEIGEWGVIDETAIFDFLTPWYRMVTLRSNIDESEELEPGIYGKTYLFEYTPDPPKVELIDDPVITGYDSLTIPLSLRQYCQLSDQISPFAGYNALTIDGLNRPEIDSVVSFNGSLIAEAGKFEFWYQVDEVDLVRGELFVPGVARVFLDGYEITGFSAIEDGNTTVFLPPSTSAGWHHLVLFFTEPASALFHPRNRMGNTYFSQPSLFEAVIQTGGESLGYTYSPYYIYGDYTANELKQFNVFNINNPIGKLGSASAPALIRIYNAAVNPSWRLMVGSEEVQSDKYFLEVLSGQVLEVSSFPQQQMARIVHEGTTENVYDKQDLTKTNFITIPPGASTLIFNGIIGNIEIVYREEHSLV